MESSASRPRAWNGTIPGALCGAAAVAAVWAASSLGPFGWAAALALGAAVGAVLARHGARWRSLSLTDPGTGIYNRRYLFARLRTELARAERNASPLSFVVVDVDNMRQHNNVHGHLAGDAVLQAVAKSVSRHVRRGDVVGRWGGEEFGIILPGAGPDVALAVAERVRGEVAMLAVEVGSAHPLRVTVSAGAAASIPGEDWLSLVDRADKAMYEAKKSKNRVVPAV